MHRWLSMVHRNMLRQWRDCCETWPQTMNESFINCHWLTHSRRSYAQRKTRYHPVNPLKETMNRCRILCECKCLFDTRELVSLWGNNIMGTTRIDTLHTGAESSFLLFHPKKQCQQCDDHHRPHHAAYTHTRHTNSLQRYRDKGEMNGMQRKRHKLCFGNRM